jgi:hypothetical protein
MNQKHTKEPWETEPDQKDFVYVGLNCAIRRTEQLGHLCGYVQIPEDHALAQMDYNIIFDNYDIDVHGGLTFSGSANWLGEKGSWWIGFDCGHLGDFSPEIRRLVPGISSFGNEQYRDIEYVTAEVKSLAEQIAALAAAKKEGE